MRFGIPRSWASVWNSLCMGQGTGHRQRGKLNRWPGRFLRGMKLGFRLTNPEVPWAPQQRSWWWSSSRPVQQARDLPWEFLVSLLSLLLAGLLQPVDLYPSYTSEILPPAFSSAHHCATNSSVWTFSHSATSDWSLTPTCCLWCCAAHTGVSPLRGCPHSASAHLGLWRGMQGSSDRGKILLMSFATSTS